MGHVERFNPAFQAAAGQLADPKYIEAVRATFAEEHLPSEQLTLGAVDALALELDDFVASIVNVSRNTSC